MIGRSTTSELADEPDVTVVMCPRDRFSGVRRAIESIYADQSVPFNLICVSGRPPWWIRRYLANGSRLRGFRLIHTKQYLTPNEARNLVIPELRTKYVVFVDNDVVFAPGWLEALKRCAEETGAEIVSPLICYDEPVHSKVHFAGGEAEIVVEGESRIFRESHRFYEQKLSQVADQLLRQPSQLAEFHCMLVRRDVFTRHGLLDENLTALHEHTDLCLTVRSGGGKVMFEPRAVVTFVLDGRPRLSDLPYFLYRWSDELALASDRYFQRKWKLTSEVGVTYQFAIPHRQTALAPLRKLLRGLFGWRVGTFLCDEAEKPFVWLARWHRPTTSR